MYAGLGIMLIIVGAVVAFGVEQAVEGFDLHAIGYILMAGGAISLLVAAIQGLGWMAGAVGGSRPSGTSPTTEPTTSRRPTRPDTAGTT